VALTVQIAKRLPQFALEVAFTLDSAPVALLGPSGAGKSMLLRCIAGIERPDRGRITLGESTLFDSERRVNLPARARKVGMLFQNYSLFPHKRVAENIAFGLNALSAADRQQRVSQLLERTHISGLEARHPRELSGGEQQRVALARALATEPEALLLDEPLSALDAHLRSQLEAQLQETFAAYRRPTLLVTHNIEEAYRLGQKLLLLSRGRIISFGPKEEVFLHPPSGEAAQLTGCKNFSRARLTADNEIEAADWNCRLKVAAVPKFAAGPPAQVGIRAHHIDFLELSAPSAGSDNAFPCWLVATSETPFRVTLYVHLHTSPAPGTPHQLQAEVSKESWQKLREQPFPWHIRLSPEALFLMPE
jgi:ABC-type sulfate/molybdate transport systems ATPase subunit